MQAPGDQSVKVPLLQKCHMTVHKRCYERGVTPCNAGQRSLVKQQSTFSTCGDEKRFSALAIDIPHDFRWGQSVLVAGFPNCCWCQTQEVDNAIL